MFLPESGLRFWLCTQPTGMRKSFDGLSALVAGPLCADPLSGQCFVCINKRKLYSLTNDDQAIRLVDPIRGGLVEDDVSNTYPTIKITIPLIPVGEIDNSKPKEDK